MIDKLPGLGIKEIFYVTGGEKTSVCGIDQYTTFPTPTPAI